jgi:metallo-beta-lactamase class B
MASHPKFFLFLALALFACPVQAAAPLLWNQPQPPFRIVGNIYYVGSKGLAAYLMISPQGDILLDGTLAENAPMIESNIQALGFALKDVKVILNSHAHFDHAGGLAQLKVDTRAMMMAADRWALEHGTSRGDNGANLLDYPVVKVDKVIRDGQVVDVGTIAMTAILTPGHTPGCTSWSMTVTENGRPLKVVFPCSMTVAANVLVGNKAYPGIVADYRKSFARLKTLTADITLPAHPEFADILQRHQRQMAGDDNAFIDPAQLGKIVAAGEADFDNQLMSQKSKANP